MAVNLVFYVLLYLYLDKVITFQADPLYICRRSRGQVTRNSTVKIQPDEGNVLVKIDRVTKKYKDKVYDTTVLNEVSLTIAQGQVTCLLGNNGSGKTTLINILVGFLKWDSGSVTIGGKSLKDDIRGVRDQIRLCQ